MGFVGLLHQRVCEQYVVCLGVRFVVFRCYRYERARVVLRIEPFHCFVVVCVCWESVVHEGVFVGFERVLLGGVVGVVGVWDDYVGLHELDGELERGFVFWGLEVLHEFVVVFFLAVWDVEHLLDECEECVVFGVYDCLLVLLWFGQFLAGG